MYPSRASASRSDGGSEYKIIKLTKYAVWLEVMEPNNVSALKIQMIQRSKAVAGKAGKWIEVVYPFTGNGSPIEGGICWEM